MEREDHERLADELESEAGRLEAHSDELRGDIEEARTDWESKRADPRVPGAPRPEEGGEEAPREDETPPW